MERCANAEELLYVSDTVIFGEFGESYDNTRIIDDYGERLNKVIINGEGIRFDTSVMTYSDTPIIYYDKSKFKICDP